MPRSGQEVLVDFLHGDPDEPVVVGALYNVAGMKDRAAAEYEQFLAKKPDHPDPDKLRKCVEANKKP